MANLTLAQIFGGRVSTDIDPVQSKFLVTLDLRDFQNIADGGQIVNDLGITNLDTEAEGYQETGSKATNLLYALILLVSQNQAANVNDDPDQKIFISEGGKRFASGARNGQIQRVININLFSDINVDNLPDIDNI